MTRQVVTPVRLAAQIAERFSAGRLSERMVVKNRDDIGRLATSFNQMAGNLQRQIGQLEELSRVQQQFVSDVSRAADPADDGPDGRRRAARVARWVRRSRRPPVGRAAAGPARPVRVLLADLLEISRFDAGAAILNAEPVDVRDIVQPSPTPLNPLRRARGRRCASRCRRRHVSPTSTRAGSSRCCATWSSTRSSTARAEGPRSRRGRRRRRRGRRP